MVTTLSLNKHQQGLQAPIPIITLLSKRTIKIRKQAKQHQIHPRSAASHSVLKAPNHRQLKPPLQANKHNHIKIIIKLSNLHSRSPLQSHLRPPKVFQPRVFQFLLLLILLGKLPVWLSLFRRVVLLD